MIILKSPHEIEEMKKSGRIVSEVLTEMKEMIRPGIKTIELDRRAEDLTRKRGAKPAFKGYRGYPASLCTSLNSEVVHGIPSNRVAEEGDILSIDFGVLYKGYYADAAITVAVGCVSQTAQRLLEVTEGSLYQAIDRAMVGGRLGDISAAVQTFCETQGFSIVRDYVGHGIGKSLHEDPQIPNFGLSGRGIALKAGMVLAIEPMVNEGTYDVKVLSDGWTVVTADGKLSAHFEHTVAITDGAPIILTQTM